MLRQGAVHRENRFSSWRNETGLLRFFSNKTTQFFSDQSDWPADNSRKVQLAGMPATAGSLPPMLTPLWPLDLNCCVYAMLNKPGTVWPLLD